MRGHFSQAPLAPENHCLRGSGGRGEVNRECGFLPNLFDADTQAIDASRFSNGRPALSHLVDGLPDEGVRTRHPSGRVAAVKASVISGFVR